MENKFSFVRDFKLLSLTISLFLLSLLFLSFYPGCDNSYLTGTQGRRKHQKVGGGGGTGFDGALLV